VDLKGQNGTYINGQRIESAVITPGTSFHLGILKFGLNRR
jgi:pSer/pThr/pTyr-binding forkhead associated (FHA) protein